MRKACFGVYMVMVVRGGSGGRFGCVDALVLVLVLFGWLDCGGAVVAHRSRTDGRMQTENRATGMQ